MQDIEPFYNWRHIYTAEDDKMKKLIDERNKMYIGEEDVIDKIIK